MTEFKRIAANECPDFGTHEYTGLSLEVNNNGKWEPFQLFYFDWLLDKEQKYYIKSLDDIKGYEVLGKIYITRNSDCILWATDDNIRVKTAPKN